MRVISNGTKYWYTACRRAAGLEKTAAQGGDTAPFEVAFANLAHAYLRDRAPRLLHYELGFQLLEKNEDNTRAVGVLGFLVGKKLLLMPLFFLNGELKGYELLYIKNADLFVPLKDLWVDYLISRQEPNVGRGIDRDVRRLGAEHPYLGAFSDLPGRRVYACDLRVHQGLPGLARALAQRAPKYRLLVPQLVKESSLAAYRFLELLDTCPQAVKGIVNCYGPQLIKLAIAKASARGTLLDTDLVQRADWSVGPTRPLQLATPETPAPPLRVYVYDGNPVPHLSKEAAEKLKRDGILFDDKRTVASELYSLRRPLALRGITENGVYDIFAKPAGVRHCLVFTRPLGMRSKARAVVIDLQQKPLTWQEIKAEELLAFPDDYQAEFRDWLERLPVVEDVAFSIGKPPENAFVRVKHSDSRNQRYSYMLITADGQQATAPFDVISKNEAGYGIRFSTCESCLTQPLTLRVGATGSGQLAILSDWLLVPEGTKVLRLDAFAEPQQLYPGSFSDALAYLLQQGRYLKLAVDQQEAIVNNQRLPLKAALIHLVRDHGLRPSTARVALQQCGLRGETFLIKYAQPYPLQQSTITMPAIPEPPYGADMVFGTGLPVSSPMNMVLPVTDALQAGLSVMPQNVELEPPPSPQLLQSVVRASQLGEKEILDATVLQALLRGTQGDMLVDRYLGHLLKAVDSLGRLYFNFLWHRDYFESRYGADTLQDLEDAIRDAFDKLGDLTLRLKRVSVEPFPGESIETSLKLVEEE